MANNIETFNSSTTWVCPAGVVETQVECWGSGGSGGGNTTTADGGSGGGGGAYARLNSYQVKPGTSYTITVGAAVNGNAGADGSDGNDTWFNSTGTVLAKGGLKGLAPVAGTPQAGGNGGASGTSVGDVVFRGGNGGAGRDSNTGNGGPGGSSAGTAAIGTDGPTTWSTTTASAAPSGGGKGGDGGAASADGSAGTAPGGGGGGSGDTGTRTGGASAAGRVTLTYTYAPPSFNNYQFVDGSSTNAGVISVTEKIR